MCPNLARDMASSSCELVSVDVACACVSSRSIAIGAVDVGSEFVSSLCRSYSLQELARDRELLLRHAALLAQETETSRKKSSKLTCM